MANDFTLLHLSDLHFHRLPRNPLRWVGKTGLGALNLLLRRRRVYPLVRALALVNSVQQTQWDHLLITGDITQLAQPEEFALAREILAPLLERGPKQVTIIPGNHDYYSPAKTDLFMHYFGDFFGPDTITTRHLNQSWDLLGWNSAQPTAPFMAYGKVSPQTFAASEAWLKERAGKKKILLANHYPLYFPPPHRYQHHHDLLNLSETQAWVAAHDIALYLHGHLHHNWVYTEPQSGTVHVNSASSTRLPRPEEKSICHRIVLQGETARIEPLMLDPGHTLRKVV